MTIRLITGWQNTWESIFIWRDSLTLSRKLALALGMACLIGLLAQARFYLPGIPVPVTGQTFAVLFAAVLMGRWWGGAAVALYAGLGLAGVPWFNGWAGGFAHLAGPTGGYIVGFILMALFVGYFSEMRLLRHRFAALLGIMLLADLVILYIPGVLHLNLWLNLVSGQSTSIIQAISLGYLPFIVGDVLKAVAAAALAWAVLPRMKR
jgi:biotin transport system substrate-specific component